MLSSGDLTTYERTILHRIQSAPVAAKICHVCMIIDIEADVSWDAIEEFGDLANAFSAILYTARIAS